MLSCKPSTFLSGTTSALLFGKDGFTHGFTGMMLFPCYYASQALHFCWYMGLRLRQDKQWIRPPAVVESRAWSSPYTWRNCLMEFYYGTFVYHVVPDLIHSHPAHTLGDSRQRRAVDHSFDVLIGAIIDISAPPPLGSLYAHYPSWEAGRGFRSHQKPLTLPL